MCELFAMSSRFPTDTNFSLAEFARHGGETADHADGWGIAYAMGNDFRIIKEPVPAAESDYVQFIRGHRFRSRLVVSHIRKAGEPKRIVYENTHPFDRELFGRRFLFAHNGDLQDAAKLNVEGGRFAPMGGTDSEAAFCWLLGAIAERAESGGGYSPELAREILEERSPRLREMGICNYLFSDGETLFAHGDTSLYLLCRTCHRESHTLEDDTLRVNLIHGADQEIALAATVPLTPDEAWRKLAPGEIRALRGGRIVA